MRKYEDNGMGSLLLAFALGSLVGAGVALLMAPKAGSDTRELLKDRSLALKDKAVETVEETRSRTGKAIEDLASQTKERVSNLTHRGQDAMEEGKDRLEEKVQAAKESISY